MREVWERDHKVRSAVFAWLRERSEVNDGIFERSLLERGLDLDGMRVPLVGPQGIFKPKAIPEIPLSITTSPNSPYDDVFDDQGRLGYAYRGEEPMHHENVGLREAMRRQIPLVYFQGVVPGRYLAAWPVYVVGDAPARLRFTIAIDDVHQLARGWAEQHENTTTSEPPPEARRAYVTATFRRRLHQEAFREKVLRAYREQCALCRLRHHELLDAAHIIADSEEAGDPIVSNGMALCKLHHAAFDKYFLAIRPDYVIEVRRDVLEEEDGPMLLHGLKGMHMQRILLPRLADHRPDPSRLERRYERFREAG